MNAHADLPTMVAYWLGELDEPAAARFEEHYLGCERCASQLAEVDALAAGVRHALDGGHVHAFVTPALVERLRARGMRLREYRVPRNGSVNCSVAPEDQMLLSRLQVPLEGVTRVDMILVYEGEHRFEDVPFDASAGEVVVAPGLAWVRSLPSHREQMRLVAVEANGERLLGEYTFDHHAG
jgi:anti-sigma factor RsiW